jgi:hypothetical protein
VSPRNFNRAGLRARDVWSRHDQYESFDERERRTTNQTSPSAAERRLTVYEGDDQTLLDLQRDMLFSGRSLTRTEVGIVCSRLP